ncbi:MAG: hypothetical protein EBX50_12680 [Chitinophagia bacterium]|nr:hypothetical protein [Chitinophagia bacterium]
MQELTEFFDLPIVFHRSFVSFGGVTGALLLSQMCYWSKRTNNQDAWFWKTQEQWEDETGLTRYEQETARKRLVSCGAISEKKEGIPCKTWFKVNHERIFELIKSNKLVCGIPAYSDAGKPHTVMLENRIHTITEITTEINTDNIYNPKFDLADQNQKIEQNNDQILSNSKTSNLSAIERTKTKSNTKTPKKNLNTATEQEMASNGYCGTSDDGSSNKATRLSENWALTDELLADARAIAAKAGLIVTDNELMLLADSFKDYWTFENKSKKTNWRTTWLNWVRKDMINKISSKKTYSKQHYKPDILHTEPNLQKPDGGHFLSTEDKYEKHYKKTIELQNQRLAMLSSDDDDIPF